MDAIEMLKAEHKAAGGLLKEVGEAAGSKRKSVFMKLKQALEAHDRIEEQVFYPAVASHPKAASFPAVDKKAHETVEAALDRLEHLSVDDKNWLPQFEAMKKELLAHVADEETKMFVAISTLLSPADLSALGEKMKAAARVPAKAA